MKTYAEFCKEEKEKVIRAEKERLEKFFETEFYTQLRKLKMSYIPVKYFENCRELWYYLVDGEEVEAQFLVTLPEPSSELDKSYYNELIGELLEQAGFKRQCHSNSENEYELKV